ncbi:MAG: universal stress protein [Chitinophagales bacterium]
MRKKIIAAFDGTKYSEGAVKYAVEIAKTTNSLLVGVFIQDMRYVNLTYAYAWDQPFVDFANIEKAQADEKEKVDLNISLFKRTCEANGVNHKVHLDKGVPVQELLNESTFADLLLLDSHTTFFTFEEKGPSPFLRDLLTDSHCPVLILPHHYSAIEKAVLCYDGSPSSVYAIRMYSYLFTELSGLKTTVVTVNEKSTNHLKEGWNFKDLVHTHFGNSDYVVLSGDAEKELIAYLKLNGQNSLVVMGAYGRNAISRLFHQSLSNQVIQELHVPVFITHQ